MRERGRTKVELIRELEELRRRVVELEAAEAERALAESLLRQHTAQLEALRQIGLELVSQLDLDALLHSIVIRACEMFGAKAGRIFLYHPERDALELSVAAGPAVTLSHAALRPGEGLSGQVWQTGRPLIVNDYEEWEGRVTALQGDASRAVMGVPIRWGEDAFGVLNVEASAPRVFSQADAELLTLLATQAAIAIRNAQLMADLKRRGLQVRTAAEVSRSMSTLLEPEALMDRAVSLIQERFSFYYVGLLLLDDDGEYAVLASGSGEVGQRMLREGHRLAVGGQSMVGWAVANAQPRIAQDVVKERNRFDNPLLAETRSEMALPLISRGRCIGALTVHSREDAAFSAEDITILQAIADQLAITIENARLYLAAQAEINERKRAEQALQQRNRDLALLISASRTLTATLDFDQVLAMSLEEIRRLMGVVAISVWLLDQETGELVCREVTAPHSDIVRGWRLAPGQGIAGNVATSGKSLIVSDTRDDPRHYKGVDQSTGLRLRSILAVPMQIKTEVIGVIEIVDEEVDRFGEPDLQLLEPLAVTVAIAIENARLYEEARQNAETRARLLREVNHRVKNNLSTIIGILYAGRRHVMVKEQPAYQSFMEDMISRVNGLATVHGLLSASGWGPLPLSELATEVIHTYLQTLPSANQVSLDVSPSPVRVSPKQANSLALLVNELVTNAVKYALPGRDRGHITVRITVQNGTAVLDFRDDGPGYPEGVLQLKHFNVGLYLIQTIVRDDLDGDLRLLNDNGAVTMVRFKILA